MENTPYWRQPSLVLGFLISLHVLSYCISLIYTSKFHPEFHVIFDPAALGGAALVVAGLLSAASLFIFANFSFGYVISYHFYTMLVGFFWINHFTDLDYDHRTALMSAAASAIAFFVPALFITRPFRQRWTIPIHVFDRFLVALLILATAIILVGAAYNFRIVGFDNFAEFRAELFYAHVRSQLTSPVPVNYLVGITSGALLPFAFACFAARARYWHALTALVLLVFFFPITLSKLSLFTPVWLVFIALLSRLFEIRIAAILSLLVPMLSGLVAVLIWRQPGGYYFDLANFRMMVIPSNALSVYNDFFAHHALTHFCQIGPLKFTTGCPYDEQLGVVMERAYGFGNYNASLFATEGIASVGLFYAPVSVFACGLIIALGNRLSAGLPPPVILMSSSIIGQVLLNVPLSTALLTHGTALIFLLWYITPRKVFERP